MKKLTKALAATLLVAIVAGVFAALPAFAATDMTEVVGDYGTTLYDMDSQSSITVSNVGGEYPTWPKMIKGTEDGQTVWTLDMAGTVAGDNANSQDYWTIGGLGNGIRIRDDAAVSGGRAGGTKNTDYLVLDFDVATDTEFIDDIFINVRMYGSGATSSLGNSNGSEYPAIGRGADGKIYVSNANGANKHSAIVESNDKWTHITFVYDFHSYESVDADTGETVTLVTNKAYAYINGYYVGTITSFDANTAVVYFMRVQTVKDGTLDLPDTSTKFANLTLKKFDAGYDGVLSTHGALGAASLYNIPELQYCVFGAPGNPEGYVTEHKLADIQRGTDVIPVYDADDLHGDLLDGDVVTVYSDPAIYKSAYAIKCVYDEAAAADRPANIVWKDANGIVLGEEGSLYAAPTVLPIPSAADWAVIKSGAVYQSGSKQVLASKNSAGEWVVYDPLYQARYSAGTGEVILFDDYVGYGVGKSSTPDADDTTFSDAGVSPTTASTKSARHSQSFVYDLNGHTFTNATLVNHWSVGYGGNVTYKNGTISQTDSYNMLMMSMSCIAVFENCTVNINGSIFMDHRYGAVYFIGCTINSKVPIDNVKAVGNGGSGVVIDGCVINSTAGVVNASQVSASSQRQGGGSIYATYRNSTVNATGPIFYTQTYANGSKHTGAVYMQNDPYYNVSVIGSDITTYDSLTKVTVYSLPGNNPTGTGANNTAEGTLKAVAEIDVIDSKVSSMTVAAAAPASNDASLVDISVDIDLVNSAFKLQRVEENGDITLGALASPDRPTAKVSINRGEGCLFNVKDEVRAGAEPATVTMDAGCVLAYTSAEGYDYIVTSSTETYTYKIGDAEPVEFVWNKAADGSDMPVMSKLVEAPSVPGAYKYTWAAEGKQYVLVLESDLSLDAKLNLTLLADISLNLYLPADVYESAALACVVTDTYGNTLTGEKVTIDGVDYYKFIRAGIAPTVVEDNAISARITVTGTFGETVVDSFDFAVIDYFENYVPTADEKENALIDALLNYIGAAYDYKGIDKSAIEALIPATEYVIDTSDAALGALAGVDVAVKFGSELAWALRAAPGSLLTVTYYESASALSEDITVPESGVVYLPVSAADLVAGITVAKDGASASVNLAGYYGALSDDDARAMIVAIYSFAKCAAEYRDSLPTSASDADELSAALAAGGNVILDADITVDGEEASDKNVINVANTKLDLADKNIVLGMSGLGSNWMGLSVEGVDGVEITGKNGGIIASEANKDNIELCGIVIENASDAAPIEVTISGGKYVVGSQAVYLRGYNITANITGGFFQSNVADSYLGGLKAALNSKNGQGNKFVLSGGTFVNFDITAASLADTCQKLGGDVIEIAEGYEVVTETQSNGDVWYTVQAIAQ